MPKINISSEKKEENFDAIAPRREAPVLVATDPSGSRAKFGSWGVVFMVLFLVTGGALALVFRQYLEVKRQITELQTSELRQPEQPTESTSLLDKINQHILLPRGQEPQITFLKDTQELKKQETFYEYAQDGDVLVQFNSLEIIYNPAADVVVNARSRGSVAGAEVRAVQGAITIEIRNGSGIAGLAAKTAETFKGVKEFVVEAVGNASRSNYPKTILVNLSNKDITGLEKQFNIQSLKDLPAGERPSTADVVIILGRSS